MRIWIAFFILMIHLVVELGDHSAGNDFRCGADVLVGQLGPLTFLWGVVLPVILLNQQIVKNSFQYQYVIRSGSWKSILLTQLKKITLVSLIFAITYIVCVILYCKLNGLVLFNWDKYDSMFYIYTQQQLKAESTVVYIYATVCIFLRCLVINHILLLFFWGFRHEIVGMLVVICLVFDEAIRGDKWICRLFPFDYRIWCEANERARMVLQFVIYAVGAIVLYRYILLRKELNWCE